jgi:hypothetical protein
MLISFIKILAHELRVPNFEGPLFIIAAHQGLYSLAQFVHFCFPVCCTRSSSPNREQHLGEDDNRTGPRASPPTVISSFAVHSFISDSVHPCCHVHPFMNQSPCSHAVVDAKHQSSRPKQSGRRWLHLRTQLSAT